MRAGLDTCCDVPDWNGLGKTEALKTCALNCRYFVDYPYERGLGVSLPDIVDVDRSLNSCAMDLTCGFVNRDFTRIPQIIRNLTVSRDSALAGQPNSSLSFWSGG